MEIIFLCCLNTRSPERVLNITYYYFVNTYIQILKIFYPTSRTIWVHIERVPFRIPRIYTYSLVLQQNIKSGPIG
jgi:hypothetical protein